MKTHSLFRKLFWILLAAALTGYCSLAWSAPFEIQTGYYVGDGADNRAITGVGFSPDLVILKDDTTNGAEGVIFKTSEMSGEFSLVLSEADANLTTNHIQSLDADGFTVGSDADVNGSNVMQKWIAFGNSDCSAAGTFCVGSYVGNGTAKSITAVGFQPDLVVVKRAGATVGIWRSSAMAGTVSQYFNAAAELASGGIESLDAAGFTVGSNAAVNTDVNTYYFFAFKQSAGIMDVGTYTGDGIDNRNLTSADDAGLTFHPDFVFAKGTGAVGAVGSTREFYGDRSFLFDDLISAANHIQGLRSAGGFQVGNSTSVNTNLSTYYYAAFGGGTPKAGGSGSFEAVSGSYTGNGTAQSISGLGFTPDLVIIKNDLVAQYAVFKTSLMAGDRTGYLANGATVFTGGITSLDADGFSVGANAAVNTNLDTYYWTAFGGAVRPDRAGGASDFLVGQYIGTGNDSTNVDRLPFQPDLVTVKMVGTSVGVWRTSNQAGDNTLYFTAVAQAADFIQALNSDGFQKGTNAVVNTSATAYDYFAFKSGEKFKTGTYTGSGASQDITGAGFQPEHLWVKKTTGGTARAGALRAAAQAGDAAQPFLNTATQAGAVTALLSNGFRVNTSTYSNENTFTYQYAAWDAKEYSQAAYRFFNNDDSTDVGAPLAAENTAAALGVSNDRFRLRLLLRADGGNLVTDGGSFKLQFAAKGSGSCAAPSGGVPADYTDVTASTVIGYFDNAAPADGAALAANANDPLDGGRTVVNQSYEELNNFSNGQGGISSGRDGKWDFSLVDNGAAAITTYCFRAVTSDGTALDAYLQRPELQVPADTTRPSATIFSALSSPTYTTPIPITMQFSEQVTGFTLGDITVGSGSAGSFSAVAADTYTAEITPTGQGTVTVDIAAGVAQDRAGNDNLAASQFSIIFLHRRRIIVSSD